MFCQQEGVLSGSDFYFFTPSPIARKQLFYFTSVGHFECDLGYRVSRENYGNYLLLLVKKGRLSVTTEGTTYVVKEGDIAFIDCYTPHEYHAMGYVDFLWVHFDGANSEMFYQDITKNLYPHPVFHMEETKGLERKLSEIIYNQRYEKLCTEYEDSLHIYELLIELTMGFTGKWKNLNNPSDQVIEEAVRYIGEHLDKDLPVRKIADHVGLSESHFNRKFRQAMNRSPKEYIIRRRMLSDDYLKFFEEWRDNGLLYATAGYEECNQGSICLTDELPSEGPVDLNQIWLHMDSQQTINVSQEMFESMVWDSYKKVADRFGLVSFGCCDPLERLWPCLSQLQNLRKASISPWTNEAYMGEVLAGTKTIYQRKPSPNYIGVSEVLDEDAWRDHITTTLKHAKDCTVELTIRDAYTIHNNEDKAKRCVEIMKECIADNWNA